VAVVDGEVQGLAHFRTFARPLAASKGLYLDDLFTSPSARGKGLAAALLTRLAEIARDEGATVVRWITASDNETARSLYDRVSTQTPWVTYDLAPADR
jgi:GNAT superfamily N-acetyltransferase